MSELVGFLLITVDPSTTRGSRGFAWNLIEARLAKGIWPIYSNTRNRKNFTAGKRLAFYVGGTRKHAGEIVATATIRSVESWSTAKGVVDPERYLTQLAGQVLRLDGVQYLECPIRLKERVSQLSFAPVNMKRWGIVLMGGCRALSERDWDTLFSKNDAT